MSYKILVINPGSTSTKIGVYEDETYYSKKHSVIPPKRLQNMQPSLTRKISVKN